MPCVTADRQLCLWCMPKTASAYCECVLVEERGAYRVLDQHDPAWLVHREEGFTHALQDIPSHVGTIRDPWSWYASLWRHAFHHPLQGRKSSPRRPFAAVLAYSKGAEDFRSFLYGATHLDELKLPYEWLGAVWVPRAGGPQADKGLWSWALAYMYAGSPVEALIDAGHAAEGLRALGLGATMPPRNTAGGWEDTTITDYTSWYDPNMLSWVARADGGVAVRHGYETPCCPSTLGPLVACPR